MRAPVGLCRVTVPDVLRTGGSAAVSKRLQTFFTARLSSGKDYWVEVAGTRLTVYKSQLDRHEKARLQLTDAEIKRVQERKSAKGGKFVIDVEIGGQVTSLTFELQKLQDKRSFADWIDTIQQAITKKRSRRSGHELWRRLAARIPLVCQMQRHWGDIHSLYGEQGSVYEEQTMPRCMRHPDSSFSRLWDLMQIILLILVCWYVPLRMSFDIEVSDIAAPHHQLTRSRPTPPNAFLTVEERLVSSLPQVDLWSVEFFVDLFTDIYFICDVFVNFRTAYFDDARGVLVSDPQTIAKEYAKSWLVIDVVSCLPVGYLTYFECNWDKVRCNSDEEDAGGSNLRALKVLRLLRLGKMLRLAKFSRMLKKYDNIAVLKPIMSVASVLGMVFLAAHLLSCLWFAISADQEMYDDKTGKLLMTNESGVLEVVKIKGWKNQVEEVWWGPGGETAGPMTRYITSMYGVFNGLENAYTDFEKVIAILSELVVGSLIYGGLAAVLTDQLTQMGEESREFNSKYKALKVWMQDRGLKKSYINKVLNYFSHKYKNNVAFDQEEILDELPPALGASLM
eukprot:COSAG01_NODE_977_length_12361_cov_167.523483_5_plen_564_part_00